MDTFNDKDFRNLFIGVDEEITLYGNNKVIPINFDNAATTPVFKDVANEVLEACKYYGSIGRGTGQKSEICTRIYEECRQEILSFFNANENKYTAIFVGNTTEGINRLSNMLIESKEDIVITTRMEHHSNDLPWRNKCMVDYIEVDKKGRLALWELKEKLKKYGGLVKYVSVTAASNVTGYINNIKEIAKIVHKYNAKLIVDGAQIVAHKKIEIEGEDQEESIDFFVFSAHKIYAPFGCGAIIGLKETFENCKADYVGGGSVEAVFDNCEKLLHAPEKNEVGSPNFLGVVALIKALKVIRNIGYDKIEKKEEALLKRTIDGINKNNKIITYGDIKDIEDRLGIIVFNIEGMYNGDVARKLAELRAIAVRQGAFCAHPYVRRLLNISEKEACKFLSNSRYKMPGMVRMSFGLYNTCSEVDILLDILSKL